MDQQLIAALNKQLANWNVLYTKLHNYHWYVTGPEFFTLHTKFEEYYNEAGNYIDEIAERILTIKGKPVATLREYLEVATIEESNGKETAHEMVGNLVNDFELVVNDAKQIINTADGSDDQPTADLFIGIKTSLEQHIWMLNAFNSK
ncbi:Dps family protein [Bacillus solimangrovi]|uniref:DNA starvation/stationary phase protection protein n=1 Tax=Bacillus solimangrovi TaxID=1305675 RepID=A0A1E5LIA9_9BACI|nr:Dps family protein [Bacillus solimangrovi]OEH93805.1 DNA starvation/stationary phase protection protein [Bacillus solimangrovi]